MGIATILFLCSFVVGIAQSDVTVKADRPYLSVPLAQEADLECCYTTNDKSVRPFWVKSFQAAKETIGPYNVRLSEQMTEGHKTKSSTSCGTLTLKSVKMIDSGLYQCWLNSSNVNLLSHGTYLHVYKPLDKTLNLKEITKNKILMAEGILLLLCVILPSATLLFKSKKLHQLEKKKVVMEKENIYQGLNLEDCCTAYDKIEKTKTRSPYQDVCNIMEEEEEIQLEKP